MKISKEVKYKYSLIKYELLALIRKTYGTHVAGTIKRELKIHAVDVVLNTLKYSLLWGRKYED